MSYSHHSYNPAYDHMHDGYHCHAEMLTPGQWTHTPERKGEMKTTIHFGCLAVLLFLILAWVGIIAGIIALFT